MCFSLATSEMFRGEGSLELDYTDVQLYPSKGKDADDMNLAILIRGEDSAHRVLVMNSMSGSSCDRM